MGADGLAQLKFTPIINFCDEIPPVVFRRLAATAFVFVLNLNEADSWEDLVCDTGRRVSEVRARCRFQHAQAAMAKAGVRTPFIFCLFTADDPGGLDETCVEKAREWASSVGLDVLRGGRPVRLESSSLRHLFYKLVNDKLAPAPADDELRRSASGGFSAAVARLLRQLRREKAAVSRQ